jgi:hypothetical protein
MKKLIAITLTAALALTGDSRCCCIYDENKHTIHRHIYRHRCNKVFCEKQNQKSFQKDKDQTYYRCEIKWHDLKVSQVHYEYES